DRLAEIAVDARLRRALDQLTLVERRQHHDRDRPLLEHAPGGLDPVEARHLDVEQREVGLVLAGELDGLLAVARLGDHLVAGALEQAAQVEPDDRLVFRYQDLHHGLNRTSARVPVSPVRSKVPRSSSGTSARTIERRVPSNAAPSMPRPSSEIASTPSPLSRCRSTRTWPPPCSSALPSSSEKTSASAVARWPARRTGSSD